MTQIKRKAMLVRAALLSWLVAVAELTAAVHGIVAVLFKASDNGSVSSARQSQMQRAHHHYNYYVEFGNGTRIRQFVPILYDDRRAQTLFLHNVLLIFALPGLAMPALLFIADKCGKQHLYVWWICWITLQNIHSFVDFFVMLIKCIVNLRCVIINDKIEELSSYWTSVCFFSTLVKNLLTPVTIYHSICVLGYYQRLSVNSPSVKRGITSRAALTRLSVDSQANA